MSQELIYTSASRGLKPGSRGFCTVLSTQGMSAPLASALESLSGYRAVYPPGDPRVSDNPVVFSHVHLTVAGKSYSVLSRISDYGLDYSQRANKLAHHLVLDRKEQVAAGPAEVLRQPGTMVSTWSGEPRVIPTGRTVIASNAPPTMCRSWQEATGDSGWAGVLAESVQADPARQAYIVVQPGVNVLPLIVEAISLLPEQFRWNVTFSTYFTSLPPGTVCQWRCVLADSPEAQQSRRFVQALRIDLTRPMPRAIGGALVNQARSGGLLKSSTETPPLPSESSSVENPSATGNPVMVPLDGDNRVRKLSGGPPPPPRKRTRTLADIPDASPRRWVTPTILATLVLLLLGTIGGGFYLWPKESSADHLVADEGGNVTPGKNKQTPSLPKRVKTPSPATKDSHNRTEQSAPPKADSSPPTSPAQDIDNNSSAVSTNENLESPANPMDSTATSPDTKNKDSESSTQDEDIPQTALYWVTLPDIKSQALMKSDGSRLELDNESNLPISLLVPEPLKLQLRGTKAKDTSNTLAIEYKHLGTWNNFADVTVQSDGDHKWINWKRNQTADHFQQLLTWCAIRVGDDVPKYIILRQNHAALNKTFKEGKILWKPEEIRLNDTIPELSFNATISIQAGDNSFTFSTIRDEAGPLSTSQQFTIKSDMATKAAFQYMGLDIPHDWNRPLGIVINLKNDSDEGFGLFLLDEEELFVGLEAQFDKLKCSYVNEILSVNDNSITTIISTYTQSDVTFSSLTRTSTNLVQRIKDGVKEWKKFSEKQKNELKQEDTQDAKNMIESYIDYENKLNEIVGGESSKGILGELGEQANRIQSFEDNLKTATITSAKIYYTVHGPNGTSLDVPIVEISNPSPPSE